MMKSFAVSVSRALPDLARDAVGVAAAGAIAYGAWLIYPPAGFITGGVLALAGVVLTSFGKAG
jgi:hypothetical protein